MKKGFTIVELCISIALLTVILAFALRFVVLIKSDENNLEETSSIELIGEMASFRINKDITTAGKISSMSCTSTSCTLTLSNSTTRIVEVTSIVESGITYKVLKYSDNTGKLLYSRKMPEGVNITLTDNSGTYFNTLTITFNDKVIDIITSK